MTTKESAQSVEDTVSRLKGVLESKGIKLFAVIDHSGEAVAVGLELRDTKVVIFGSPLAGPHELAARYGLSDELAGRLSAIDVVTDAVIEQ